MTENEFKPNLLDLKAPFSEEADGFRNFLPELLQEVFAQEIFDLPGAGKGLG